jgi:hypothetical protein
MTQVASVFFYIYLYLGFGVLTRGLYNFWKLRRRRGWLFILKKKGGKERKERRCFNHLIPNPCLCLAPFYVRKRDEIIKKKKSTTHILKREREKKRVLLLCIWWQWRRRQSLKTIFFLYIYFLQRFLIIQPVVYFLLRPF